MKQFYGKWKRTKSGDLIWKWKLRKVKKVKK
jgi:hypothetical protein